MGAKLAEYFDKAAAKGGLQAQVKLAMITKMSRNQAISVDDSTENVTIFENALTQL